MFVRELPLGSTIFIDIDGTVMAPVSKTFHIAPYRNLIDDIKINRRSIANFEEVLSNWRIKRKVMLIDEGWPAIISQLRELYDVYGLTKMETGSFGCIPSMETWRHKELAGLGIEFTPCLNDDIEDVLTNVRANGPNFYKGIFFTGNASKSETINTFKKGLHLNHVVFIDDRLHFLLDMESYCKENRIPYQPLQYIGLDRLSQSLDERIVHIQHDFLIKHAIWLEDDEARLLLERKTG